MLERIARRNVLENASQAIRSIAIAASRPSPATGCRAGLPLADSHPAVRLDVTIGNTRQVENKVLDGTADMGLVEGRTGSDILRRAGSTSTG